MAILFDRYPDDVPRTFCINERMQAFLPLMEDRRTQGWTFAGLEEGCTITNEAVFRAIAKCPLHANEEGHGSIRTSSSRKRLWSQSQKATHDLGTKDQCPVLTIQGDGAYLNNDHWFPCFQRDSVLAPATDGRAG